MHNIIIEYEFDTYGSIADLNVMFVLKVDMIIDKREQFNGCLLAINKLKIKKLIIHFKMH